MKRLAARIERNLALGEWNHCAVYEHELERLWPQDQEGREAKINQFGKKYGFRLKSYQKGLCAIFDNRHETNRNLKLGHYPNFQNFDKTFSSVMPKSGNGIQKRNRIF